MSLKPLQDNVLLKPDKTEEKMESGLYRPGTAASTRYQKATVLAIGPGKLGPSGKWEAVVVEEGDVVLYDSNYAIELEETKDDVKLLMCSEGCLLAREEK
ncbi:hypothetical protein LCGC14_0533230 [marine sediment metagenome]|uniref:10 kDa chaperonin n=1 Tax=marine sediment metagenome TaxID=412755 RepID=A0A0F9RZM8_9ZZZZ